MKTTLITGVSKGIGRALAEKFLIEGYRVIGTSLTGAVDYTHPHLIVHQLDLSQSDSISRCSADIARFFELAEASPKAATKTGIDILINNAGVMVDNNETCVIIDKLRKTLEVNLIGTIDFTEHVIPLINVGGHIINISSAAGSLTETDLKDANTSHSPYHYPAYKISKCALNMYTRTLAMRMQHDNKGAEKNQITVSSVHPGWVKTDMGGSDADITPEEAANQIFKLSTSQPETGHFWFNGKKYPW